MDCCSQETCEVPESNLGCPRCGRAGRPVEEETVRAILKPGQSPQRIAPGGLRFCATPSCGVLYFGGGGWVADKGQAQVRVGIKETDDPVPLCYCFGHSRSDVVAEVAATGGSTIPDRIAAEVKAGRCSCETKNPSGACCLGEVRKAVTQALASNGPLPRWTEGEEV